MRLFEACQVNEKRGGSRAKGRGTLCTGWRFFFRRTLLLIAVGGILSFAIEGAAQLGMAEIEVIPPNPTTDDRIEFVLSGTWRDGCVPGSPRVMIVGNWITIATSNPSVVCPLMLTDWSLRVPIGKLSAGTYWVTVTYSAPGVPTRTIGTAMFTVRPADPDFVVKPPKRVYGVIAPPNTTTVLIFEVPSGRVTGRVPVGALLTSDVHIAITSDGRYGLVAPPNTTDVLIFDIPSGTVTGRVPVGVLLTPNVHIAVTPDGRYGLVALPNTAAVLIFDIPSGTVTGRVPVGTLLTPGVLIELAPAQ